MSTRKKVNVSESLHEQVTQEARRLKLSRKDYLEAAVAFFMTRHLDPRTYQPETSKQVIQQAVDRVLSYLVFQEKNLLQALHAESTKARILSELSVNHLLTLIAEDETVLRQLQQQDQQYLAERLQQANHQSDINPAPQ